jgi:tetratricopeptide (TPR) repeat protein
MKRTSRSGTLGLGSATPVASSAPRAPHWSPRARRRLWLLAGLVCCGVLCWFAYDLGSPQARAYYHRGKVDEALAANDLARARGHLEHCLAAWPRDAETHFRYARISRRGGDHTSAAKHLKLAESLGYRAEECALERLLLQVHSAGARGSAEATLVRHLQTGHPDELLILEALVAGYLRIHHLAEVNRWATVWITRYPNDWRAWFMRGRAHDLGLSINEAFADYRAALRCSPEEYEVQKSLGELLREKGMLKDALPHLRFCHERSPDDAFVATNLARCLRHLGESETARTILDGWLAKHGRRDGRLLSMRAWIERDLAGAAEALPYLREAQKLVPRDPHTIHLLSSVLRELGQIEEAEGYDRKAEDIRHQHERLVHLTRMLATRPDDVELRFEAGRILHLMGLDDGALQNWQGVLEIAPDHRPTLLALADYYESMNDHAEAENYRLAAAGKRRVIIER